jgi:hypothetical protein
MTVAVSLKDPSTEELSEKLNIQLEKMRDLAKQAVDNPVTISSINSFDWGAANVTLGNDGTGTVWNTTSLPSLTGSVLGSGVYYTNNTSGSGTYGNITIGGNSAKSNNKVSISGENADIEINGKSMTAWMERVEQRLNILTPNTELEKEWDDLRRLGERYRKLEKKCKEKALMWETLKKMPKVKL